MERANSRSVMLLNVLGNTRTTMAEATSLDYAAGTRKVINLHWIRPCHLYTPPVVATDWVTDRDCWTVPTFGLLREVNQCLSSRGSKSRNKVAVGEPAAGSLRGTFSSPSGRNYFVFLNAGMELARRLATFDACVSGLQSGVQPYGRCFALPLPRLQ
eukprot:gene6417-2567_t